MAVAVEGGGDGDGDGGGDGSGGGSDGGGGGDDGDGDSPLTLAQAPSPVPRCPAQRTGGHRHKHDCEQTNISCKASITAGVRSHPRHNHRRSVTD